MGAEAGERDSIRAAQHTEARQGRTRGGRLAAALAAALTLALASSTAALSAPTPDPYATGDAGGFLNILPPGQNGHASSAQIVEFLGPSGERPPHSADQLDRYEDLVFESPTLDPGRLFDFYKDATFGIRGGDEEHRYSPREDVTIARDRGFGVPHVYGEDRRGAMFGAGYVGAEDNLFLMDVLRHAGRAQLSSFIGGDQAAMDREQWRLAPYEEADLQQQYDLAEEVYGAAGAQVKEDVDNYVQGINKYICEARPERPECTNEQRQPVAGGKNGATPADKLPGIYNVPFFANNLPEENPKPRLWTPTDVIATASLVGGIFGKGGGRELDSARILQAAQAKFGDADGEAVWGDFRSANDPEAPHTTEESFPYQVPPADPESDSVALPDPGTVEESSVSSSGAGAAGLRRPFFPRFDFGASNALVVSGAESESGRPLAVFGPQTGYFIPQLLMELDMHAPAKPAADGEPARQGVDARGAAFAGVNLYIQLGRGRDYAWSATSAGQDNTDTFALELCNGGPDLEDYEGYEYRGECLPFQTLTRTNEWSADSPTDPPSPGSETLVTRRTKLGLEYARAKLPDGTPVVYTRLRSTYFHEADSARGFVDFNDPEKMRTPADFREAAYKIGFTFNWFFVNRDDIAYFNSGDNPLRPEGPDPNFPVRACPTDATDRCKYEWVGWDPDTTDASPNMFVSDYTPPEEHPQSTNPPFFADWYNKQAPDYRAADDNYGYQSIYRSQPLEDRIRAGIADGGKMTRTELIDAMEDAGTVDFRGDKVLPWALRVLGDEGGAVGEAIAKLRAWHEDGAHRRDRNDDGEYEHSEAIKIMDAWWPRWVEAQFKPELGDELYNRLVGMIGLDNRTGPRGSAFNGGWYGYAEKDLRALLGEAVEGEYSRRYCGGGDLGACREALRTALEQAVAAAPEDVYPGGTCEDEDGSQQSAQYCHDAVRHQAVGAISVPPIHWINRPTFQQVVEVGAATTPDDPGPGDDDGDDGGDGGGGGPDDDDGGPGGGGGGDRQGAEPAGDATEPLPATTEGDGGELPFTGLVLGALALLGILLAAGGYAVRRRLRRG